MTTAVWLTVAEAADRAKCCPETIRRAIRHGNLPAGGRGRYKVRPADVDRWVEER